MALPFTLRQLEYLEAVAAAGSISGAASRMHVSASAVVYAIDALEVATGNQLLVRRKAHGVALTPLGTYTLTQARGVLDAAHALTAALPVGESGFAGHLPIGCFPSLLPVYIPDLLSRFEADHPRLQLEIIESPLPELREMLLAGRIEGAIMPTSPLPPEIVSETIHRTTPYVLVSSRHPLADQGEVSLRELAGEPFISLVVSPSPEIAQRTFAELGLEPTIRYRTTSFELLCQLVARGFGYALAFQRRRHEPVGGARTIAALDVTDKFTPSEIGLVRLAHAPLTTRMAEALVVLRSIRPDS